MGVPIHVCFFFLSFKRIQVATNVTQKVSFEIKVGLHRQYWKIAQELRKAKKSPPSARPLSRWRRYTIHCPTLLSAMWKMLLLHGWNARDSCKNENRYYAMIHGREDLKKTYDYHCSYKNVFTLQTSL